MKENSHFIGFHKVFRLNDDDVIVQTTMEAILAEEELEKAKKEAIKILKAACDEKGITYQESMAAGIKAAKTVEEVAIALEEALKALDPENK